MKFLWRYVKPFRHYILGVMLIKLMGTVTELLIPYVMEHLLDHVVPARQMGEVYQWGGVMLLLAILTLTFNVTANRLSVRVSRQSTYAIRRDLFHRAMNLSGGQMDHFGLPSLISRMTSDTYNVQNFTRMAQTMGIRAPIMLLGGIAITLTMDTGLAAILCIMAPVMIALVVFVSMKGIPLYERVQQGLDDMVRIMREGITGIRVVKALSKEKHEVERFGKANDTTTRRDIRASIIMALPGPVVTVFLNVGLTLVILIGAQRVNSGLTQPGVILAFLTYFNMILMGVMGLNRIFMMMSKANASAGRIREVTDTPEELFPLPESEAPRTEREGYLIFDHVSFNYNQDSTAEELADGGREKSLKNIDFSVRKGGSLGILGATGAGKTTIINLLMRFYDPQEGHVYVDGRDVRTYPKDELRRKFGSVFQNDTIFADSIRENVSFGHQVEEAGLQRALEDAMAWGFVSEYEEGIDHEAAIHGANFSGGQKQRLLIARAFAGDPEVLVLDDASSALDYRTDAALRQAIRAHHGEATMVVIAQRVSSIMSLDEILVLDEGEMIGRGTHAELMESCPLYREICRTQMGEVA